MDALSKYLELHLIFWQHDAHSGIKAAKKAVMPSVPWQRCQFHLQQNAQSYITALTNRKQESSLANILATFVRCLTL
jgi:transposase-like protein